MARRTKYSKKITDIIVKAISEGTNRRDAARAAGICEATLYEWLNSKPELIERIEQAEADKVKEAESQLWQKIQKGDTKAIVFYLQSKRPELYRNRTEVTGADGGPLQIQNLADAIVAASDLETEQ